MKSKQCECLSLIDLVAVVREALRQGMSINLYMFHGGTNFGFINGAMASPSYKALVTSYGLCFSWSEFCNVHNGHSVALH